MTACILEQGELGHKTALNWTNLENNRLFVDRMKVQFVKEGCGSVWILPGSSSEQEQERTGSGFDLREKTGSGSDLRKKNRAHENQSGYSTHIVSCYSMDLVSLFLHI